MNTNGLAKHYDKLNVRERLSAVMAAEARGDDAELSRLLKSAKRQMWNIVDVHRPREVLRSTALLALADLLQRIAHFNECYWLADAHPVTKDAKRLSGLAEVFAYYITVELRGWEEFCATLAVDPYSTALWPEQMTATVRRAANFAPDCAKTAEEVAAFLRRCGKDAEPVTAESVADGWRTLFEELTK
jgi:hypothetical protein